MAVQRFKLNHAGMADLLKSPGIRADLRRRAESAASAARSSAPVETGAYRDSIHVVSATTDRAVERVTAGTNHALVVEANLRVLGRSIDAAGG